MVYERLGTGQVVVRGKLKAGDIVATCDNCGDGIVALESRKGDWVACCKGCAEWTEWMKTKARRVDIENPEGDTNAEVIPIHGRREMPCLSQ